MSKKRSLFRRSLVWIGLTCALTGGPGVAVAETGGCASNGLGGLAAALEKHGWSTNMDAVGSLLVHRSGGDSTPEANVHSQAIAKNRHRNQQTGPGPDRLASLGAGLRHHGWGVERRADGSLSLYPPVFGSSETASQVAVPPPADNDESRLTDALAQRGWDLQRDAAGNVLLIPAA